MSEFAKLNWLEIGMLTHAFVSYVDNNIPFKLTSGNVLYTFLDAYKSAFDAQRSDNTSIKESSFISVSACLYFYIDDCLNLLNGVRSEHPFIKINSINAEWLRTTGGIREVLMEMQFLLRFNVFRQQISILLGETFIMTDGLFAHLESIYLQCLPVIEGGIIPLSLIPVSKTGIPFIEDKGPLVGVAGVLIRNENILPCYRAISHDYMLNTRSLFPTYVSDWINIKANIQSHRKQPAEKKQKDVKSVAVPKGEVVYDDSALHAMFDNLTTVSATAPKVATTRKKNRKVKKASAHTKLDSSSSSSSSIDLAKHVQDANDFSLNTGSFEEVTTNRERKYVFTPEDHLIISQRGAQIVEPLKFMFASLFVKGKMLPTGLYLNIFHKKPTGLIDVKKSIAHLSLHPINDLYHFKITAFRQFNLPLPPEDKDYTISFKMHRSIDSGQLTATIQPSVHNKGTEVECPDNIIRLFRNMLDIMVAMLNGANGGIRTRRFIKNKNKNKRTKKRN